MIRKITSRISCLLAFALMGSSAFAGAGNTPMQTFINREKESNTFLTVSNIWQPDNAFDQTAMLTKVEKAQPLLIDYGILADFMKQKNQDIQLVLPKQGGGTYTISLGRYDFLAGNFKVLVNANGNETAYPYTPGLYYRGVVDGIPGSVAAFSFFNNEVYGIFSIPNEGNYVLVPNTMVGKYYDYNTHYILYNDRDLKIKNTGGCATDQLPDVERTNVEERTTTTLNNNVYNNCREINLYDLADYSTYVSKGHSVTNVTNYTTALFNNQSTLYRNEGILINLQTLKVDTTVDSYDTVAQSSGSTGFLFAFGQATRNNLYGANIAMLLSTKYGTLGGVAWLQSMCSSYSPQQSYGPYAYCNIDNSNVVNFPTYSWDVTVVTHEMGHIVGSPHTHRCCWNYPGRNTAIDGCYTLEGTCSIPSPQYPTAGGTIMSYCHLVSGVGINYSNGFGQQPGDTIRYFLAHNTCGSMTAITHVIATPSRTITANRECLDPTSGITYYWNDHNTADQSDDTLALMIKKGTNNIGTLDSTGFSVKSASVAGYGGGSGLQLIFPIGTPNIISNYTNTSMRRYWQITATSQPASPVEVIFPFLAADTADINGSLTSPMQISNMDMYMVNKPVDPSPASGFNGLSSNGVSIYTYGTAASTSNWSLSGAAGGYLYAHMLMSNLSGGGAGFVSHPPLAVNNVATAKGNIYFYPNPSADNWNISIPQGYSNALTLQITSADGKTVHVQVLNGAGNYTVNGTDMAAGIYFYRLTGNDLNITGSLVKSK